MLYWWLREMKAETLVEAIRAAISQELEIDPRSMVDDASLRREYGLDSVAAVNIVFALERDLGLEIDMKQLARIDSINELIGLLARELTKKRAN